MITMLKETYSFWIKEADKHFSLFIRLKESDSQGTVNCFICGSRHWYRDVDCAHYINRDVISLRYSEDNCHAVCVDCNRFDTEHQSRYRKTMCLRYGLIEVIELDNKRHLLTKLMRHELQEIADKYKHLYNELKKEKKL